MKYRISIIVIWFLFVLAAIAGFVAGTVAPVFSRNRREYANSIFDAQNRATAALFGWSGDRGVSHECGKRRCVLCRVLCKILSWALNDKSHCEKAAAS